MLTATQFQQWCREQQLTPATADLIAHLRTTPPSRRVTSRAHNVSGAYCSRKMGVTVQFESHTVELWGIYAMEHDAAVLEYYDQPPPIPLTYQTKTGRTIRVQHTPDFFVLRSDGAGWEEWKSETRLQELAIAQPHRYQRTDDGQWCCPPGEAYAASVGLTYRVRSSAELHPTYIRNLIFLEDYCFDLAIPADSAAALIEIVRAMPGITLATLLLTAPHITLDVVYALIARNQLYTDLSAAPLVDHAAVQLYRDKASADAYALANLPPASDRAYNATLLPHPQALAPHTRLSWDGRIWTIINVGQTTTTLQPEAGALLQLPTVLFRQLLDTGTIRLPHDPSQPQLEPLHPEVEVLLRAASPDALTTANRRFELVQAYLQGNREPTTEVTSRTVRSWVTRFRAAEQSYACGYVGLLPHTARRGNRAPRLSSETQALMDAFIQAQFEQPTQPNMRVVYQAYHRECLLRSLRPASERTFYRRVKARRGTEQTAKRKGERAAYGQTPWYWELDRTTPRHGDRPWEVVHLDHTELDIELRSSSGKLLGRPWATFMVDAYSRRLLAVYLAFDPPSYRSCMMAIRICVRRFERMPQSLIIDGGREFHSLYFDSLLARYYCTKKTRPWAEPRFGSVIERLFGTTNTEFVHNLRGNTQATKVPRQRTRTTDPKERAVWTLGDLYHYLCEWAYRVYDQDEHPALGTSPHDAYLLGLDLSGQRAHRQVSYNEPFLMATRPTTRKGTAKVIPGQGVKVHHLFYWNDAFRHPEVERTQVPIRYDPFDIGVAYAYVQGGWVQCISQNYSVLAGHSHKELELAAQELRQQARVSHRAIPITTTRLADLLANVHAHEAILLQRLRDLESRAVVHAGMDRAPLLPSLADDRHPADRNPALLAPLDLAALPIFEEYR